MGLVVICYVMLVVSVREVELLSVEMERLAVDGKFGYNVFEWDWWLNVVGC
jgi:hypothetical protein